MDRLSQKMHYLWRSRLLLSRPRTLQLFRLQHGGPHKEYFQNPGQMPPSEPSLRSDRISPAPDFLHQKTLRKRLWDATGLAALSILLGLGAGSSLITWAYLQGPFQPGTAEETEMLEEITEMINEHPATEVALNGADWEELPLVPRMVAGDAGKGLTFVTGTLTGSKGIVQVIPSSKPLHLPSNNVSRDSSSIVTSASSS
jgi:hypothetical protein